VSRPVALVTGASAGIGEAFARHLAAEYDLVLVARRRERLDALSESLRAGRADLTVRIEARDLGAPDAATTLAADLTRDNVVVDLLVNNAGFGYHGRFIDEEPANAQAMIALNVAALVALTHAFLPGMVARKRGGVINVASTASFQPVPNMAIYGATKAFVESFTEAVHEEVYRSGVQVVALCPGATATEFFGIAGERAALGPKRSVDDVVRTGMRALERNAAVAIDGPANLLLAESVRVAPRAVLRPLVARMMGLR
jgi:short-subunit dehydrogenase